MMKFHGYRVNAGTRFPEYHATLERAKASAQRFTDITGEEARVYGLLEKGCHLLTITRKKFSKT